MYTQTCYSVKHEKKIYVKILKLKKNCQIYRDKKEVVIANRGGGGICWY